MEPLPETVVAFDDLDVSAAHDDLLETLVRHGERVRRLVPHCTGLSFTLIAHDVTFTLLATAAEVAALDVVSHRSGPDERHAGVTAAAGRPVSEPLDEYGWRLLAGTTSAHGVASTLSLPVVEDHVVTGGFNLYGASAHCFEGHHEDLAHILGAWAGGAVTNADLSFDTLLAARRAPEVVRDATAVDFAVGLLAARLDLAIDDARARLLSSAARAGTEPAQAARLLTDVLGRPSGPTARGV